MYACLYSNSMIYVDKPKKAWKHSLSVIFDKFVVVSYSHADSVAARSKHFLLLEWLLDANVLPNGHAVTQNSVFVVSQSEATRNKSHDKLIRHVKETIVMKSRMQFRTNVNYMVYRSDCLIDICNTHTTGFGYPTHFSSQFSFRLHLALNAFDCLLWV